MQLRLRWKWLLSLMLTKLRTATSSLLPCLGWMLGMMLLSCNPHRFPSSALFGALSVCLPCSACLAASALPIIFGQHRCGSKSEQLQSYTEHWVHHSFRHVSTRHTEHVCSKFWPVGMSTMPAKCRWVCQRGVAHSKTTQAAIAEAAAAAC